MILVYNSVYYSARVDAAILPHLGVIKETMAAKGSEEAENRGRRGGVHLEHATGTILELVRERGKFSAHSSIRVILILKHCVQSTVTCKEQIKSTIV